MMPWRTLLVSVSTIFGLVGGEFEGGSGLTKSASAHLSTPAAIPDAVGCTIAPRTVEDLLATPATEVGLMGMRQSLPEGRPANTATVEAITQAVRELEACANAGDFLRFLALFTDAALRQRPINASQEASAELTALAAATPTPVPPPHRAVFAGPWHLEILPDGRVVAAVVWFGSESDPCVDPNRITVLLFAQQDGRWLIDERIERVAEGELIDLVGSPPAPTAETVGEVCADAEPARGANDD
jgi:hypothetical protein